MRRARLFSRRQPQGSHNLAEDPAVFATEPRMLPFFPREDAKQTSDLFSLFQDTLLWKRRLVAKESTSKPQTTSIPEHTPRWPTSSIVRRDRSPPWSPSHWLSSYGMQLDSSGWTCLLQRNLQSMLNDRQPALSTCWKKFLTLLILRRTMTTSFVAPQVVFRGSKANVNRKCYNYSTVQLHISC